MTAKPIRRVVLVSGPPGAGKTTLAEPLAEALGFPLITKDDIKETLFDALEGPAGDLQYSRQLGTAAMALLWTLGERCPQVVLEANFRPKDPVVQQRVARLNGHIVEVYCRCSDSELIRRYNARSAAGERHPVHALSTLLPEYLDDFAHPIGVGTVIEVDTTQPVDILELLRQIQAAWGKG